MFAILHNIALICCNFDNSVEDDTMDHELIRIDLYPAQHICFLEYVSTWKDFLPGRFPAKSLLQHEIRCEKVRFSSVQHKIVHYTSRNVTSV